MGLVTTLSIDIQHNSIECHHAECRYAECRDYLNVMLSVVRLNVVMLSVVVPHFTPTRGREKVLINTGPGSYSTRSVLRVENSDDETEDDARWQCQ